jgi:hypothetical protein
VRQRASQPPGPRGANLANFEEITLNAIIAHLLLVLSLYRSLIIHGQVLVYTIMSGYPGYTISPRVLLAPEIT